jgi:hypothetical protein
LLRALQHAGVTSFTPNSLQKMRKSREDGGMDSGEARREIGRVLENVAVRGQTDISEETDSRPLMFQEGSKRDPRARRDIRDLTRGHRKTQRGRDGEIA